MSRYIQSTEDRVKHAVRKATASAAHDLAALRGRPVRDLSPDDWQVIGHEVVRAGVRVAHANGYPRSKSITPKGWALDAFLAARLDLISPAAKPAKS